MEIISERFFSTGNPAWRRGAFFNKLLDCVRNEELLKRETLIKIFWCEVIRVWVGKTSKIKLRKVYGVKKIHEIHYTLLIYLNYHFDVTFKFHT